MKRIVSKTAEELELMFMKHYAPNRCLYIKVAIRVDVNREVNFFLFFSFFFFEGGGGSGPGGGGSGWGVRVDVNEELKFL